MMFLGVVFFKDKKDLIIVNGVCDVYFINLIDGIFKVSYRSSL